MANDLNRWTGIGRLGADPETRRSQAGDNIVNLRLACGKAWKDRDSGDKKESTEWIPVVVFGHSADYADKYMRKGDKIYVEGEFKTRKWKDQQGNDRYSTEIVVSNFAGTVTILASAGDGGGARRDDRDRDDRDRDRGGRDRDHDDRDRDRGGRNDRGRDDDRGRGGRDGGRDDRDDRRGSDRGGRDDRGRDDDRGGRNDDRRRDDRGDSRSADNRSRSMDDDIPF